MDAQGHKSSYRAEVPHPPRRFSGSVEPVNSGPVPMQISPVKDQYSEATDFSQKVLHLAWHPTEDTVAAACGKMLYIYQNAHTNQSRR